MQSAPIASLLLFPLFYMGLDLTSGPFRTSTGVSLWVLSPGLSVALLARFGLRFAPLVTLSALLSLIFVWKVEIPLPALVAVALAITGGYTTMAALIRSRLGLQVALWGPREVNRFAFFAVALTFAVASAGVAVYVAVGFVLPADYWAAVFHWWIGDAIGLLLLTPVLMLLLVPGNGFEWPLDDIRIEASPANLLRTAEIIAQAATILVIVWLAVRSPLARLEIHYLAFLPLIWIALRQGLPGAAIGALAINAAFSLLSAGYLPLSNFTQLQVMMMTLTLTGLILGATVSQRERARQTLLEAQEALETRVRLRTRQLSEEVEQRKRAQAELAELAQTDSLTGVLNRRHLMALLRDELERFKRYERPFTVLFLDIDFFKRLNDTYGHHAGDEVLRAFTGVCLAELRCEDRFGRFGGEEFCAILPETRAFTALELANRLRSRVAASPVGYAGHLLQITVSIGVAEAVTGDTPEAILARADAAMYRAKQGGRDRVAFGTPPFGNGERTQVPF